MQKNKKARTQDTGKEENKVDDIRPDSGKTTGKEDTANKSVTAKKQGKATKEANPVLADASTSNSEKKSKSSTSKSATAANATGKSTKKKAGEENVKAADLPVKKSTGGTKKKNTPGSPDKSVITSPQDREAIIASVDADAEKQTGRPTGAIYGSGGDIIAVQNPAGTEGRSQGAVALAKVYGVIQASKNTITITQGSVSEGALQLTGQANEKGFYGKVSGYKEQFVTVLGEYGPQGGAGSSRFMVRSIASHNDIARRAYELSQSGESSSEDNWIRAENELLNQG